MSYCPVAVSSSSSIVLQYNFNLCNDKFILYFICLVNLFTLVSLLQQHLKLSTSAWCFFNNRKTCVHYKRVVFQVSPFNFSSTVSTLNLYPATHLVVKSTLRDSALISPIFTLLVYLKMNI